MGNCLASYTLLEVRASEKRLYFVFGVREKLRTGVTHEECSFFTCKFIKR